jgi:hypothetical protein
MRGRKGSEQGVGIVVASPDEYGDLSLGNQGREDSFDARIDLGDEFPPRAQGLGSGMLEGLGLQIGDVHPGPTEVQGFDAFLAGHRGQGVKNGHRSFGGAHPAHICPHPNVLGHSDKNVATFSGRAVAKEVS